MSSVATYTKSGAKSPATAKLSKEIFDVAIDNHELIKNVYVAYLANGRQNLAKTKARGEVRGGGRKPWRQKGLGRARFGSTRNPIWRGGGIAFGPTGQENYTHKINATTKRKAIKQALSMAVNDKKIIIIETFECKDAKTTKTSKLLDKIGATGSVLMVVSEKNHLVERATRNLSNLIVVQAKYLNVYNIVNADHIVISQKSLAIIHEWLGDTADKKPAKTKEVSV